VVAAIMKATNLTREAYAMNHPAGRIGNNNNAKFFAKFETQIIFSKVND